MGLRILASNGRSINIPEIVAKDDGLTLFARILYGELSSLCAQKGYCWASNSYLAKEFKVTKNTVSKAINELHRAGYISISYKEDNERIVRMLPLPVKTHTQAENAQSGDDEDCPTYTKKLGEAITKNRDTYPKEFGEAIPENREQNSQQNNQGNNQGNKDYNVQSAIAQEFASLWKMYPRKRNKKIALQAYTAERKKDAGLYDKVKRGIEAYLEEIDRRGTDDEFIKTGGEWFKDHCWEDEYTVDLPSDKREKISFGRCL